MFILQPDQYLLPDYKISPFTTADMQRNSSYRRSDEIDQYFEGRFANREFTYTINGRRAIHLALRHYRLAPTDYVTIFTTSGNGYISGCVTSEIEKFCLWNREVVAATKIIFVIHEFGYIYPDVQELKKYGLPIIEDSAYAFYSSDHSGAAHNTGDFVILSFPKMFPIQVGALLVSKPECAPVNEHWDVAALNYIKNAMSHFVGNESEIRNSRLTNYVALREKLKAFGCQERFVLDERNVPGVYMFRVEDKSIDLKKMRDHFFRHGIQCSVFFGEQTFFIPLHQGLTPYDMDYFVAVAKSFLQ